MDRVDPLPAGTPQLAFDHPAPNRLATGMYVVVAGQVLCRQRRTEAVIDFAAQYLHRFLLGLLVQLAVGRPPAQGMY
jgi:hypothetical protein